MNLISYHSDTCIRNAYYYNNCSICVDECPEGVFSIFQNRIKFQPELCTLCSACLGGCPTQAIKIENFNPERETLEFTFKTSPVLECKNMKNCLASFDTHHLSIMALQNRDSEIVCDLSLCQECSIGEKFQPKIEERVKTTNQFLNTLNIDKRVKISVEKRDSEVGKREIFGKVFEKISDKTSISESDREKIEARLHKGANSKKFYPLKHKLLIDVLDEVGVLESSDSFNIQNHKMINSIDLNSNCTNCGDCIQFCPTDALFYSSDQLSIYINSSRCIGCEICSDICKVDAISEKSDINSMELLKPTQLIKFSMEVCSECKTPFIQKGDEKVCDRCKNFIDEFSYIFKLARDE